jgi:hypothetical protein
LLRTPERSICHTRNETPAGISEQRSLSAVPLICLEIKTMTDTPRDEATVLLVEERVQQVDNTVRRTEVEVEDTRTGDKRTQAPPTPPACKTAHAVQTGLVSLSEKFTVIPASPVRIGSERASRKRPLYRNKG